MNKGDAGWDYGLEEEAEEIARHVRAHCLQHSQAALAFGPVPMFTGQGHVIVPIPLRETLHVWETDPDNKEADREFIRQMRRTDLRPGSFFVVIMRPDRYHWWLDESEEGQ
jgi:hypothetical protein